MTTQRIAQFIAISLICLSAVSSAFATLPDEHCVEVTDPAPEAVPEAIEPSYDYSMYSSPDCMYYTGEPATAQGFPIRNRCLNRTLILKQITGTTMPVEQVFSNYTDVEIDEIVEYEGIPGETHTFE